jgi:long-chain fatty acid transport protein
MKRTVLLCTSFVLLLTGSVAGSNIDYLSNRSADYIRNFMRNAATDGADLVSYNPAGLAFLDEGLHLSFGNQFILKDYTIDAVPYWDTDTTVTYESTEPTLILPDLYAVYRSGDWAAFGAFTVPAGGGSLDYTEGIYAMPLLETGLQQMFHPGASVCFAVMDDGFIRAGSRYLAGTAGVAFAVSDILSVGLAGRYTTAKRTFDGAGDFTVTWVDSTVHQMAVSRVLDVEKTATGFNGILSLDLMPAAGLNVAMRYETRTSLEFETKVNENSWGAYGLPDSSFTDGYLQRRDLPAVFAGGVSYQFSPELKAGTIWNYYFVEDAAEDSLDGLDDDYADGWDLGMGLDYQIAPRALVGLGYLYSNLGGSEDTFSDFEYNLDCHCLGGGVRYALNDDMALTLAGGRNFYLEGTGAGPYENSTYDKKVWYFGLGAEISFR